MAPKKKVNELVEVLESMSDAFISVDLNFTVTYMNKPAEEFLGRKRGDIIGKNFQEALPQYLNTVFQEVYLQLVNEKEFTKREKFEFETFLMNITLTIGVMFVFFHMKMDLTYFFRI